MVIFRVYRIFECELNSQQKTVANYNIHIIIKIFAPMLSVEGLVFCLSSLSSPVNILNM